MLKAQVAMLPLLILVLLGTPTGAQVEVSDTSDGSVSGSGNGCTGFLHGVASGDPRPDSVILWTRFTPEDTSSRVSVTYTVSTSADVTAQAVQQGTVTASPDSDFTVKVDVTGLQPGTRYYYYFTSGDYSSLLGTTRTAPAPGADATIRFAQMSCSNWRWGYFSVYNMTSRVRDLDFLVALGDWIYEYENTTYPAANQIAKGRAPIEPPHELATLEDYRARHKLFHTDAALVEMMRRAPMIAIWDDHETANNAFKEGAENSVEGTTWENRRCAGVQAYIEYMPIRNPYSNKDTICGGQADIYRTLTFGKTMTMLMTEQRVTARDEQYNETNSPYIQALRDNTPDQWSSLPDLQQKRDDYYAELKAPHREILGESQLSNLKRDVAASAAAGVSWQVIGSGVVMGPWNAADVETAAQQKGLLAQTLVAELLRNATDDPSKRVRFANGRFRDTTNTDSWSGYQHELNKVLDILSKNASNPVVLSGDVHNAYVWSLFGDDASTPVAVEFTDTSVSSPGYDSSAQALSPEYQDVFLDVAREGLYISNNKTLKYTNLCQRGVTIHTVTPATWRADYLYVESVKVPTTTGFCEAAFEVSAGTPGVVRAAKCTPFSELLFDLYGSGDPLNPSTAGTFNVKLDASTISNTKLSSCKE